MTFLGGAQSNKKSPTPCETERYPTGIRPLELGEEKKDPIVLQGEKPLRSPPTTPRSKEELLEN